MADPTPAAPAERRYPPLEPFSVGLKGCCPRCGQGRLFSGVLALAKECRACRLDYSFADSGDGPAVFVILIAGMIIMGGALWFEFTFHPPVWLHVLIWAPLTLIICISLLRLLKGVMVALQYVHKAGEGRIDPGGR